jgi:hypothetical protein
MMLALYDGCGSQSNYDPSLLIGFDVRGESNGAIETEFRLSMGVHSNCVGNVGDEFPGAFSR